jgi:polar amino acid transport system substrate-binding protein
MSKTVKLVMLAAVIALLAAACSDDDDSSSSDAGDLGGRTVTVAVENAYTPYNFVDTETNEAIGWDYDAWREICERLNCVAEFVQAGWPDVIVETGQGEYDTAADGISITDDRKEVVDFSDPYMVIEQKFMVRVGEDRFSSVDEFVAGDYRLGTQVGTTNFELGVELLGGDARIDAFEQFGVAVLALVSGDVDAVIIDDTAGQGYKGENEGDVELIDEALQSDPLGFIFPPGSDLVAPVNTVIKEMTDDGTFDELANTWFVEFSAEG